MQSQIRVLRFLTVWIGSSIYLLVASLVLGNNFELGSAKTSQGLAALSAGFLTTVIIYTLPIIVVKRDFKITDRRIWILIYILFNAVTLWVLKRFADYSGVGIKNNLLVVLIAVLISLLQIVTLKYANRYFSQK